MQECRFLFVVGHYLIYEAVPPFARFRESVEVAGRYLSDVAALTVGYRLHCFEVVGAGGGVE